MKILHIIDSGGLYGAEKVLLNLMAEQIKMGLDPTIASIGEKQISEKPLEAEAIKRGFRVVKFRMFPGPNPYGMLKVLRYARQNEFDILHSHGYKGNVAFGLMPKKLRKIPLVSTLHGWTSVNGFSKNRVYEWLDLISLKYIDAVVLVNRAMLSNPRLKSLNEVNYYVVNNGIPIPDVQFNDSTNQPFSQNGTQLTQQTQATQSTQQTQKLDHFSNQLFNEFSNQPLDKEIVDFCSYGFTIGSIGRLSTEKGYKYLIEALDLLIKKGIDARLVIIGEGYCQGGLESLVAKLGLSDRVFLPGYRENGKRYIPLFSVFVLPSLTEGLPLTILEAMQAKVPIVATEVGGIPEVLDKGKAGLLVKPSIPSAFADAFMQIYKDHKLAGQLVNAAYDRTTKKYSSELMSRSYLEIYEKLLPLK